MMAESFNFCVDTVRLRERLKTITGQPTVLIRVAMPGERRRDDH